VESTRGVRKIAEGIFTGPSAVSYGFIFDCGDIDPGEITRARQPGQWPGVPAVGFAAVTGLLGNECGGHHPAVIACFRSIPGEPGATGASLIDKAQRWGFRWHLAEALIDVTRTCADGLKGDDLGAVLLSEIGDRNRVVVDIPSEVQRARLAHG
jgi:hypothetical protein